MGKSAFTSATIVDAGLKEVKTMIRNMKRYVLLVFAVALLSLVFSGMVGAAADVPVVENVIKDPTDVPTADTFRTGPNEVTVNLVAKEVIANLAPDKKYWFWTFALDEKDKAKSKDGTKATVPGPMIRAKVGDTIIINLRNDLQNVEPHNIDFHAAMGPGGGAAVTNVEPDQTATLKFKALRAGAFIYHCAGEGMPWEHVAHGMYGLIQIDPVDMTENWDDGFLPKADKEFYVGQGDWYITPADADLQGEVGHPGLDFNTLDLVKASAEYPVDLYTFNGHQKALSAVKPFNESIRSIQNDKVRFFFVTGGPNIGSNWHIIGTIFDKVYTGSPRTPVKNEETVYIPPGSAAVFELTTPVPGRYLLVDHALFRVPKGAAGFLHVDAKVPPTGCTPLLGGGSTCTNPGSWPFKIFSPIALGTGH